MPKDYQPIIKAHRELFRAQEDLADFSIKVLGDIRTGIKAAILDTSDGDLGNPITLSGQADMLRQVDSFMAGALKELQEGSRTKLSAMYEAAYLSTIEEITFFADKFPKTGFSKVDLQKIKALEPRITGAQIEGSFKATLNKITIPPGMVREELRSILAVGNITGQSYGDIAQKILDNKSINLTKGVFKTAEERARVIAITEMSEINSFASIQSVAESNKQLSPEKLLSLYWSSLLDRKTSTRCRKLNGQVRKVGQEFEAPDGWRGLRSPAHPRCRSMVHPYRKAWASVFDELEKAIREKDSKFV